MAINKNLKSIIKRCKIINRLVLYRKIHNPRSDYQKILKTCVGAFQCGALSWVKILKILKKIRNLTRNHNLTGFTLLDVIFNQTIRLS